MTFGQIIINDFSYTHQKSEVTGQTTTLKSSLSGVCSEIQMKSASLEQKLIIFAICDRNTHIWRIAGG